MMLGSYTYCTSHGIGCAGDRAGPSTPPTRVAGFCEIEIPVPRGSAGFRGRNRAPWGFTPSDFGLAAP